MIKVSDNMQEIKDGLIGFAIGDAMGVPIEFETREFLRNHVVTEMIGYGNYDVPEGVWSDDTAMTLATMDSMIQSDGINYNDMADRFCNWINDADYTATNVVFDIGITTKYALMKYWDKVSDAEYCGGMGIDDNGNGSLMRMLPIAFYIYNKALPDREVLELVRKCSSITHAHEISILGCYLYVKYISFLLAGNDKYQSYQMIQKLNLSDFQKDSLDAYQRILDGKLSQIGMEEIDSTGYVVSTLEASLWVIMNTKNYSQAIIGAIHLGGDTDTIGAITGSIAGLLYGVDTIPDRWIKKLRRIEYLEDIAKQFQNFLNMSQ